MPTCGSVEHGAPYVDAPAHVSIAHTRGLTIVAAGTVPIGVDVEREAPPGWVRTEAVGKARGTGITGPSLADGVVVVDLDLPGHVAALAVVSDVGPEVRAGPARAATPRTGR